MTDNALTDKAAFTYQLRGAFRAYEIALGRYLQSFDLPLSHFYVFQIPWLEGGHSQKHLADHAFMSESVLSQVLKKMIEKNLVARMSTPLNMKQGRKVILTEKGNSLRNELLAGHNMLLEDFLKEAPGNEVSQSVSTLSTVRDRLNTINRSKS